MDAIKIDISELRTVDIAMSKTAAALFVVLVRKMTINMEQTDQHFIEDCARLPALQHC
jgi:hypothetical protein